MVCNNEKVENLCGTREYTEDRTFVAQPQGCKERKGKREAEKGKEKASVEGELAEKLKRKSWKQRHNQDFHLEQNNS